MHGPLSLKTLQVIYNAKQYIIFVGSLAFCVCWGFETQDAFRLFFSLTMGLGLGLGLGSGISMNPGLDLGLGMGWASDWV